MIENRSEDLWNVFEIHEEKDKPSGNVDERHEWNKRFTDLADAFDPTDNHNTGDDSHSSRCQVGTDVVAGEKGPANRV